MRKKALSVEAETDVDVQIRDSLAHVKRVVIKLGSRVLVTEQGKPETARMRALVKDIANLQKSGVEVIVVSSGAIGTGMEALGLTKKPTNLPDLQMAAAVGQNRLMTRYDQLFSREGCLIGQVLLTYDGLKNRERHLNTRNTFMALLRNKIIPIVNENDTVSVDEIKFGDNDVLGALVAMLVEADVLVLLSSTNGLKKMKDGKTGARIPYIEKVTRDVLGHAQGKGSAISSGGMKSKLESAQMVVNSGGLAIIADGRSPRIIREIFKGEDVGTRIGTLPAQAQQKLSSKKRWIAFYHKAQGAVIVNPCAAKSLTEKGSSLLPVGIESVQGEFTAGTVINIKTDSDQLIARGLSAYSSEDIFRIMGLHSKDVKTTLGSSYYEEVIHRDNMVVFN